MKEMSKAERILALYEALMSGRSVNRREWAEEHGICERSVRRDLDAIRRFFNGSLLVSRNEFRQFVTPILDYDGFQALEWLPRLLNGELEHSHALLETLHVD